MSYVVSFRVLLVSGYASELAEQADKLLLQNGNCKSCLCFTATTTSTKKEENRV